jgi:hypothetical protein
MIHIHTTRSGMRALCGAAMLAAACGDRPPEWSRSTDGASAFGLRSAVALVDPSAERVVMLQALEAQGLARAPIALGRNVVNVRPSPHGEKLFVLSAGHRAVIGDDQPDEAPSLTVIDPRADQPTRRYDLDFLTDALFGLTIDPIEERWAVLYAAPGPSNALVRNPNELVFIDLDQPPGPTAHVARTLFSFGGRPERLTFTGELSLPTGPERLLIVESDQDLSILRLDHLDVPEITVPLTSATDTRRLTPAGIIVDDGDPARDDDARIGVRLKDDSTVITLELGPAQGGNGFLPRPNLTDVGGVPSDIAFVRTDGGLRLAALVPTRSKATLIDPVTNLTTDVMLPTGYRSISLVTQVTGATATGSDVALLWNGTAAREGVAFWELGQTAGQPYRSIETLTVAAAVDGVLDVPTKPRLKVLRTAGASAFYVLDLATRTAAPLLTSTPSISHSMSPAGDQVWTFVVGGTEVASTDLTTGHPRSLLIERPVHQVFEVERADGGLAAMVLHASGGFGATIYDATKLDDETRRLYTGLLTEGPY